MMDELMGLLGGVGCFLSGMGLLAGILLGNEPVIIGIMVAGIAMMLVALGVSDKLEKKRAQQYRAPKYNYYR